MQELPAHPLAIWESFYVIVGSSAAALTGLQFIVVAFIADRRAHISARTLSAFATPAIIHYSVVLFVASALSAPWLRVTMVIAPLVAAGVFGFAFTGRVVHKMRSQREYEPVLEDWVWHAVLPLLAYGALCRARADLESRDDDLVVRDRRCVAAAPVHRHSCGLGYRHVHRNGAGSAGSALGTSGFRPDAFLVLITPIQNRRVRPSTKAGSSSAASHLSGRSSP